MFPIPPHSDVLAQPEAVSAAPSVPPTVRPFPHKPKARIAPSARNLTRSAGRGDAGRASEEAVDPRQRAGVRGDRPITSVTYDATHV
jgi:hypothetical protein